MRLLPPLDENFKLGVKYQRLGLFDEAILKFIESLQEITEEPFMFYHIGECYLRKGHFTDAENSFLKIQKYFDSKNFEKLESKIKRQRMNNLYPNGVNILLMSQFELHALYSSVLENSLKKEKILNSIQIIKEKSNDNFDQGLILLLDAKVAKDNGEYVSAKGIAENSLNYLVEFPLWCARAYKLLGEVSWRIENLELGKTYLEKSRDLYEQIEEFDRIGMINLDIGLINLEQGNYRAGSKSLHASRDFANKTGNVRFQALSLTNLGNLKYMMGEYEEANQFYTEAEVIWKIIEDIGQLGYVTSKLTAISKALGKEDDTLTLFRSCLGYLDQSGWDYSDWANTMLTVVDSVIGIETIENIDKLIEKAKILIDEKQISNLDPFYFMVKAKVELFKDNRGEAKSLLKSAEVKANEKNQIALLRKILLILIETLLEEYLLSYDEKFLTEANDMMKISMEMSTHLPVDPDYLRLLAIEAHFATVDGDIEKSKSLLEIAEQLADEKGIFQEKKRIELIREYTSNIEKRKEKSKIESVISVISSTRYNLDIDFAEKIQGVIYLMGDKGMVPVVASEKITPEKEAFHIQSGAMLSFLTGQGHSYNEGVYGPIPAIGGLFGADQFLLAITKSIKDEKASDPRFQESSYCVIAISYPKSVEKGLPHRSDLEELFIEVLQSVHTKEQLTDELLEKILTIFKSNIKQR